MQDSERQMAYLYCTLTLSLQIIFPAVYRIAWGYAKYDYWACAKRLRSTMSSRSCNA